MRKVRWSPPAADELSPDAGELTLDHPVKTSGTAMKALAAFLLGLTLGVTFIIFGETAVTHFPGQEPESVWVNPPALRH